MKLASQISSWPTRKLAVGAAVASAVAQAWNNTAPDHFPALAGGEIALVVGFAVSYALGLVVAWFVKDRENEPD